jgi:hypothetical protein
MEAMNSEVALFLMLLFIISVGAVTLGVGLSETGLSEAAWAPIAASIWCFAFAWLILSGNKR